MNTADGMNGSGGIGNSWNYEAMRTNAQWNIFPISKVSSLRQWYRRGQMIRLPHSTANTEKRYRSEDCWCGWAKAMWYEWMIESVLIYIVCERLSEVWARETIELIGICYLSVLWFMSRIFFRNVQNWADADQSDIKWVSEMNFLNCWTWSVIDTSRIATQPNDPIPSSLWISFCSLSLSRCCWRPRQRQIHGCRCKSIRLLAKWTIYLNKIPIIWWQWRR